MRAKAAGFVRKWLAGPMAAALTLAMVVFAGTMAMRYAGMFQVPELAAYDGFVRARPAATTSPARVALVEVTDRDIRELDTWPMSDATLKDAFSAILAHDPRAVGLDIYRDVPVDPGHEALNALLAEAGNVIAVYKFEDGSGTGVSPPPALAGTERIGLNDFGQDPGGMVRRGLLFGDDGQTAHYAFALRLALHYLHAEGIVPAGDPVNPEHIRLGATTIAPFEANDGGYVNGDAHGYQFLLDFRLPVGAMPAVSLTDLLNGNFEPTVFEDKVVLIGVTAESLKDFFTTPHSRNLQPQPLISGVELHAQVIDQLLRISLDGSAPVRSWSDAAEIAWVLTFCLVGGMLGLRARSAARYALTQLGGVSAALGAAYLAHLNHVWIPAVQPMICWFLAVTVVIAYLIRRESEEREQLMSLFSRHVSREIAEDIWRQRDMFLDGGRPRPERLTATAMFTDLVGYTTVAESLEPDEFFAWLNEYMEVMTNIVVEHHGVVMRFAGDAIFVVFGVPVARRTEAEVRGDAVNAARCALAMEAKLIELNRQWSQQQRSMIGMRLGIYTGPVMTGSVGNGRRLEYNAQGDTINTAARLETWERAAFEPDLPEHPCRILLGEATRAYLDEQFATERIGEVQLKGKQRPVVIHRLQGMRSSATVVALPDKTRASAA